MPTKVEIVRISRNSLKEFKAIAQEYLSYVDQHPGRMDTYFKQFPDLFLGAFEGGKLVGIVFGHIKADEAIIEGIAVLADYWRQGIGTSLLNAFERNAKRLGARKASVGAAIGPINVVGFYEKCGYRVVQKKPDFWIMEKNLT